MRLAAGLPTLRQGRSHQVLLRCLAAAADRHGLRILHYSAQGNHVHMICEAENARSLSRGMQGLCVRIAYALNQLWKRAGKLFEERFHCRQMKTPHLHHEWVPVGSARRNSIDLFSSACFFDGWSRPAGALHLASGPCPFPQARTFLMTKGWRKHGLIDRPG
jgi:hypothetical protein